MDNGHPVPTLDIPSLGDQPDARDLSRVIAVRETMGRAQLGEANPMWNDQLEMMQARALGYLTAIPGVQGNLNDRIAKRFPLQDMNMPRDSVAVLQAAIRYCYENPFVAKATRIKADFTVQGFKHKTHNTTVETFLDNADDRLNMKLVLRRIYWMYYGIGLVPIWWGGEDGGPITFIEVIDPRMVHIEYNFGKATMYLKIDEKMKQAVADPNGEIDIRNRARFRAMPSYWIPQIRRSMEYNRSNNYIMGLIELQEGSYAIIENRYSQINRTVGGVDGIPLQPAFHALQRYQLLSAGDFAVAWNLKNMVTLISEGDPKSESGRWTPITTERLSQLQAQFQRPDSSFTVYCDPTTKVEFVFPPVEIFDVEKYIQPEKEIKEVLNLPSFMWATDETGASFGNSVTELKLLRTEVQSAREVVGESFFKPFYERLRQGSRPFNKKDTVLPSYNETTLQDDASWFQAVTGLYGQGGCSMQFLQEQFGIDVEYEREQMKFEHKQFGNQSSGKPGEQMNDTIYSPLFEPSQGNMNPIRDKGGNPSTSNASAKPSSSSRSPRKDGTK